MESLRFCTLTGADEHTDIDRMISLSEANPQIEWGILCSRKRQEEENGAGRYPRMPWIESFLEKVEAAAEHGIKVRCAIHLCGADAVDVIKGDPQLVDLTSRFDRAQLNVRAHGAQFHTDITPEQFERAVHSFTYHTNTKIILQRNVNNEALFVATRRLGSVEYLHDGSGGRGIEVKEWPKLDGADGHGIRQGNAGGLGPDNIAAELPRLSAAAGEKPYWIDMENKLRVNDRFSLDACEQVIKPVADFMLQRGIEKYEALGSEACPVSKTEDLSGFWLDWYAGIASGMRMVVPPANASRPMYFSPRDGVYAGFQPSEYPGDLQTACEDSEVGAVKRAGTWIGLTPEGDEIQGTSRTDATLKAIVLEVFGPDLPSNPAQSEPMQQVWLGESFANAWQATQKRLPKP